MTKYDLSELCACVGPQPGQTKCPCELKRYGVSVSMVDRTPEEQEKLMKILAEIFQWKSDDEKS